MNNPAGMDRRENKNEIFMATLLYKVRVWIGGLIPLALLATMPLVTSCSDDADNGSAAIVVNKVFLEDAQAKDSVTDREVTFARLGQLIRIEGSGFTGLKKIYINGYDTYFNNALMTDNDVWVTLNTKTPVDKADASVRNTITLVKDNGSYTYKFVIRASAPTVSGVDNTLPSAGETVIVRGTNLQETTHLTLPGGVEVTDGITSDPDGEWYSFTMPAGVTQSGSITSEGANGTAVTPAYFNNRNCMVLDFENSADLGSWSATYKYDDLVDDPLGSGRGKVVELVPQSVLDGGGIKAGANSSLWASTGNDYANDDWNRMTQFIPGSTPVDSVALQFDVYVPDPWMATGQLEISLQNNLSNYGYGSGGTKYNKDYMTQAYVWVPWMDTETGAANSFTTGGRWTTVTVPLSKFGRYTDKDNEYTFKNVIDDRNSGSYRNFIFLLVNSDIEYDESISYPATNFTSRIYLDNFRVVPCTSVTVSDY